ncbi:aspartic peptidase domain-containing protein [Abortiporus biennis]|nr:aspartic peptidase domain-containing protein [Abortiporus biennis]
MKAHGGGVNSGKGGSPTLTVANGGDTIYTVDIVVAGKGQSIDTEFTVNLDTGSVDLWVYPNATKLKNVNSTTARASINYALGFASGQVAFAEVQLGSYRIPQQIFLNADQVKDMPDEVQGVLGLSLSRADIFNSFNKTYGTEAAEHYAGTPIDNIFAQRSDDRDFFDIQLGRTSDLDDIDDGRFMIGEHAPGYEQVESEPKVFRQTSTWWGVPIESLVVNGVTKQLPKSVRNGTLVAALDTGFSLPPLPPAMVDSIYSSMPGAVWVNASEPGTWIVPCNSTANVTLTIGGQNYPIHPLDLTRVATQSLPDLGTVTYCFGTFIHNTVDYGIDGILGDPFLRNVYISYNLGDKNQGGPYYRYLRIFQYYQQLKQH